VGRSRDAAVSEAIRRLLMTFCDAGAVPCAGKPPLHIAFDPAARHVRLRGDGGDPYEVVFPEARFVEMIERSGLRPTETLIRVWLATIYFETRIYPWAQRRAASTTAPRDDVRVAG
jgi:hypothetical protein